MITVTQTQKQTQNRKSFITKPYRFDSHVAYRRHSRPYRDRFRGPSKPKPWPIGETQHWRLHAAIMSKTVIFRATRVEWEDLWVRTFRQSNQPTLGSVISLDGHCVAETKAKLALFEFRFFFFSNCICSETDYFVCNCRKLKSGPIRREKVILISLGISRLPLGLINSAALWESCACFI